MAGGGQGGGGRPAVGGNPQQYMNAVQGYRQAQAGMQSQVPGANLAAPGGGFQGGPQMTKPAVMPQQMPQSGGPYGGFNPGAGAPPQAMPMPRPMPIPVDQGRLGSIMPYMPPGGGQQGPIQNLQPAPTQNPYGYGISPIEMQGRGPIQNLQPQQPFRLDQMPQGQAPVSVGSFQPQGQPQPLPQAPVSQPAPQAQPMPRPTPRPMGLPQVMGNPNATPLQRPQVGQTRPMMLRGRG